MQRLTLIAGSFLLASNLAHADLNVFACEPEWAALAVEVGGDHVDVYSATTALQDAHKVQARPSLIARARSADLVICSGAELEIGWLPVLLRKSGNGDIQPGRDGYLMAADHLSTLGKLDKVDRSMGDVHAAGNPHLATDPQRMLQMADILAERLSRIDGKNAATYRSQAQRFRAELQTALVSWQPRIDSLKGKRIVVHHDSWLYLEHWLGLNKTATLEPKPGVPPSTGHLARLLRQLKSEPADLIVYALFQDARPANWLSRKTRTKPVALPLSPESWNRRGELIKWYDDILSKLSAT